MMIVKTGSSLIRKTIFNKKGILSNKIFFYALSTILAFTNITLTTSATAQQPSDLPAPQTIIEHYIEVIGGEDAIGSHTSMTIKGHNKIEPIGLESEITYYRAAPNKHVMAIDMGPMGSSTRGYNGSVAWSESAMTGTEETSFSPMGESNIVTVLSEYREFDGVLISTLRISYLPGIESHDIYQEITFNDVDLDVFVAPALLNVTK